jgi:hypothetical protein
MTNPFPFTGGNILNASDLNAIGESESWTPTFTNLTVGNGTLTAQAIRVNDLYVANFKLTFGSTTSIDGDVSVQLPVAAATTSRYLSVGAIFHFYDASGGNEWLGYGRIDDMDEVNIRYARQSGASPAGIFAHALSSTGPFTWTTSDDLYGLIVYPVGT